MSPWQQALDKIHWCPWTSIFHSWQWHSRGHRHRVFSTLAVRSYWTHEQIAHDLSTYYANGHIIVPAMRAGRWRGRSLKGGLWTPTLHLTRLHSSVTQSWQPPSKSHPSSRTEAKGAEEGTAPGDERKGRSTGGTKEGGEGDYVFREWLAWVGNRRRAIYPCQYKFCQTLVRTIPTPIFLRPSLPNFLWVKKGARGQFLCHFLMHPNQWKPNLYENFIITKYLTICLQQQWYK